MAERFKFGHRQPPVTLGGAHILKTFMCLFYKKERGKKKMFSLFLISLL